MRFAKRKRPWMLWALPTVMTTIQHNYQGEQQRVALARAVVASPNPARR